MVPGVIAASRLESAQRSAVVNVLAEAFEYDPMQAWLFPNPRRRLQRLRRFYERDLAVRLEGTATVCLLGARAVAFWQPPAGCETLSIHSAIRLAPCFVSVAAHHPFAAMNVLGAVRGLGRMLSATVFHVAARRQEASGRKGPERTPHRRSRELLSRLGYDNLSEASRARGGSAPKTRANTCNEMRCDRWSQE